MNWIRDLIRPRISSMLTRREVPDNLWVKDPASGEMVYRADFEAELNVYPSGHHERLRAERRLGIFFDDGEYTPITAVETIVDPLHFKDQQNYRDRLLSAREKTGAQDSVTGGFGKVYGQSIVAAAQDFSFLGGSLGVAAGEAIVAAMQTAVKMETPFVLFSASGGARMQEGMISLMQMPRTVAAVLELREAGLPYIVVLTDPTTGGVTASCAMLGDVHIAEPNALIGFAGPRVIEQTIRETLPKGFQRAEYLLDHGMVDMVVHRRDLRQMIVSLTTMMLGHPEVDYEEFNANVTNDYALEDQTVGDAATVPQLIEAPKRGPMRKTLAKTVGRIRSTRSRQKVPESIEAGTDGTEIAISGSNVEIASAASESQSAQSESKVIEDKSEDLTNSGVTDTSEEKKDGGSIVVATAAPQKVSNKKSRSRRSPRISNVVSGDTSTKNGGGEVSGATLPPNGGSGFRGEA